MPPKGENPRPQGMVPPLKNVQYINTPINLTPADEQGAREISFGVSPIEQLSFAMAADAQEAIVRILVEGFNNDQKRTLLDALAPGIEVATSVPLGLKK